MILQYLQDDHQGICNLRLLIHDYTKIKTKIWHYSNIYHSHIIIMITLQSPIEAVNKIVSLYNHIIITSNLFLEFLLKIEFIPRTEPCTEGIWVYNVSCVCCRIVSPNIYRFLLFQMQGINDFTAMVYLHRESTVLDLCYNGVHVQCPLLQSLFMSRRGQDNKIQSFY